MSTKLEPREGAGLPCLACGKPTSVLRASTGLPIYCVACSQGVPVPVPFGAVEVDPASAAAAACGEAALWLLNHEVSPDDVLSVQTTTNVGSPLEMYPFAYTLTLLVRVPRYLIQDETAGATPVQTVASVREMADTLSRPRTTPPTTYAPTVAHD